MQDKKEFESTKSRYENTITDLENERAEAMKNEKVSQERLRLAQEEHKKHLSKMQTSTGNQVDGLQEQVEELKAKIAENDRVYK